MRLFIAVNLPQAIKQDLWDTARPVRAKPYPVRWVAAESVHLTLKFLGHVADDRASEIAGAIQRASEGAKHFVMPIGGFGAFPSPRRPRVIWVGCESAPALELLQHGIEQAMAELGFPLEGRPFRPHLTLGRVQRGARASTLAGLDRDLEELVYESEALVESVDLMESELRKDGARYTVRRAVALAST